MNQLDKKTVLKKAATAFKTFTMILLFLFLFSTLASSEEPDLDRYREECSRGLTIYCIAVGMEEQRAGDLQDALNHYQMACEHHATQGPLRACTPYLSLAMQMDRLEGAAAPFESRCQSGEDRVCFYLAKEYIKITAFQKAYGHLERLCRSHFRPPDRDDYGPCYHLGRSLLKTEVLDRALEIFSFDCERDPVLAKPSCEQHASLLARIEEEHKSRENIKGFEPVEFVSLLFLLMPATGWVLLARGRQGGLQFLRLYFPLGSLAVWGIWEWVGIKSGDVRTDLAFILPSVLLTFFLAGRAHQFLKRNKGE